MLATLCLSLAVIAAPAADLVGPPAPSQFHWTDVDTDGFPDALVVEPEGTLRLLLGDGAGRFADRTTASGLDVFENVRGAVLVDWSGDGRDDLVLTTVEGLALLRAENGAFIDETHSGGLRTVGAVTELALVDANADGWPDVHVAVDGWHRLFLQTRGDRTGPLFVELDWGQVPARSMESERARFDSTTMAEALAPRELAERPSAGLEATPKLASTNPTTHPGGSPDVSTGGGRRHASVSGPTQTAQALTGGIAQWPQCVPRMTDQATGNCVQTSSTPTLGMLYPLGSELMIDSVSGYVGIGTTTPSHPLEVAGQIVSGTNNTATGPSSAIGGGTANNATGEHATVAGGEANQALADDAFIGGGLSNLVVGQRAVIGGGVGNSASNSAVVGGGEQNAAFNFATIAGGRSNDASAVGSTVGGGANNGASGLNATIAGGGDAADPLLGNTASGTAASVGGGRANNATGDHATIGGGLGNAAFAPHATVPGGRLNVAAGIDSFAAGRRARAVHDGAFVWADSTDADFASTAPDQFLVRAAGGMGVGKAPAAGIALDVAGSIRSEDTIVSTKASGAPLQVTSSDLVPNLNADHLDGFDASAFSTFGALVDSGELASGAVGDAQVAVAAGIAGTKIDPDFGAQLVRTNGSIAIGESNPQARLHVRAGDLAMSPSALFEEDLIVEDTDAVVGAYSSPVGNSGSAFVLGEVAAGGNLANKWTLARETSGAGSDLRVTFGSSGVANPTLFSFEDTGELLVGDAPGRLSLSESMVDSDTSLTLSATDDLTVQGDALNLTSTSTATLSATSNIDVSSTTGNTTLSSEDATITATKQLALEGRDAELSATVGSLQLSGNTLTTLSANEVTITATTLQGVRINGVTGIGRAPSAAFDLFVGTAAKPGGGSWTNFSDRRLKKNIAELNGSLETLLALRGVHFEYRDPEAIGELNGERMGFIAQEVEAVLPDWVDETPDGTKMLTVRGFEALVVEAVRELRAERDAEVEALTADVRELRALVEDLRAERTTAEAQSR